MQQVFIQKHGRKDHYGPAFYRNQFAGFILPLYWPGEKVIFLLDTSDTTFKKFVVVTIPC
jgi:hypothetical protein